MRIDVKKVLDDNNISIQLKAYKEAPSNDGYFMTGNLYVNNKRAIHCQDSGFGGGLEISILNKKNAQPLLDIKARLGALKAYPNDSSLGYLPYTIDSMFYELAEDLLLYKEFQKLSRTKTLYRWEDEEYDKDEFRSTNKLTHRIINNFIELMRDEEHKSIIIWNIEKEWKSYTTEELKKVKLKI